MQKAFQVVNIPKLPVLTSEEGIKQIKSNYDVMKDWKLIEELIPKQFLSKGMKRTGLAGMFAACLELTKEGNVSLMQEKLFDKLFLKRID